MQIKISLLLYFTERLTPENRFGRLFKVVLGPLMFYNKFIDYLYRLQIKEFDEFSKSSYLNYSESEH